MKAITTKYHGPSNVRGSFVSATDQDGHRARVPYDDGLSSQDAHDRAALALCRKLRWTGTLHRGAITNGFVYVWVTPFELPLIVKGSGDAAADSVTMDPSSAMVAIARVMSGHAWTVETCDTIATVVRAAGHEIKDCPEG